MKLFSGLRADKLVNQLITMRHHDTPEAEKAIARLSALGDGATPKIIDGLELANKTQMVTFVDILTENINVKNLPAFIKALEHPNKRVSSGVTWALSSSKQFDPNILFQFLDDPNIPPSQVLKIMAAHKDRISVRLLLSNAYNLEHSEKEVAMKMVQELATKNMVPDLLGRISGKDSVIRCYIIAALTRFPGAKVQKAIQDQLSDRDNDVKQAALTALSKMGSKVDITIMCELLMDDDIDVQNKAVDVLVSFNHPDIIKHILPALQDENEYSRRAAVEVLNEVASTESIKDLLDALNDSDWWVRSRATDALASIGGDRVVDSVLELINDDDEQIRRAAIEILNSTKSDKATNFLIGATKDPDWWVRERAVDALAEIGDVKALPSIIEMLDGHPKSIPAALRAIAELGAARDLKFVLPLLSRREKEIKLEAANVVTRLTDDNSAAEAIKLIQAETKSEDSAVQQAMNRALSDLTTRFSQTQLAENQRAERMAEPNMTVLTDNAPDVIKEAAAQPPTLDIGKLTAGDVIEGRYKFIQNIGKGAFGTVILVEDTIVSERLVLKFLNQNISADEEMMQRFVHELRYSRKITHKNVIRIYDFLKLGGLYAISMEYFPSHTLRGEIPNNKPVEVKKAAKIARDIALGMAVAHHVGIIHRDLKPANVLVNNEGVVKVVDFGVAAAQSGGDTQLTKTGYVIGSPKYMAPEQILGKKVDQRADIYSLGVIFYELLTGEPPYTEGDHMAVMYQHVQGDYTPIQEKNPEVPDYVAKMVDKVLAVDKADRYQSMESFRTDLEAIIG
ncbi:MAG: HEAT repeat domain-containing protein [Gammaproteobacteria bacterium]